MTIIFYIMVYLTIGVYVKFVMELINLSELNKNPNVEKEFYGAISDYVKQSRRDSAMSANPFIQSIDRQQKTKTKTSNLVSLPVCLIIWPAMVFYLSYCLITWEGPTTKVTKAILKHIEDLKEEETEEE